MSLLSPYTRRFYSNRNNNADSASLILKHVFTVLNMKPNSVIDFGCATGAWLLEAKNLGATELLGIEGYWVHQGDMLSEKLKLMNADVGTQIQLDNTYDIALCLEVAEHLHEQCAPTIVKNLTQSSNIIIFSAAIPHQGGANHVNEQPQSYWVSLFQREGYQCYDIIRPHFWNDNRVNVSYRQNALVFSENKLDLSADNQPPIYDIVHPDIVARIRKQNKFMLNMSALKTSFCRYVMKHRYQDTYTNT